VPPKKLAEGLGLTRRQAGQPREQQGNPKAIAHRQVAIAEEWAEAVADLRGAAAFVDHSQLERYPLDLVSAADPLEERQIVREAAERDVLAVVGRRLGIALPLGQRLHLAAEGRPGLEQRHVVAGVGELERRSESGEAAADHDCFHSAIAKPGTELIQGSGLDGRSGKAATASSRHRKRCLIPPCSPSPPPMRSKARV